MSAHMSHDEERRTTYLEVGAAQVGLLAALTWWLWSQFAWLGTRGGRAGGRAS